MGSDECLNSTRLFQSPVRNGCGSNQSGSSEAKLSMGLRGALTQVCDEDGPVCIASDAEGVVSSGTCTTPSLKSEKTRYVTVRSCTQK